MAIRVSTEKGNAYKSKRSIVSPNDAIAADRLDKNLDKIISEIEKYIIDNRLLSDNGRKKNSLLVWYQIGRRINEIIDSGVIAGEDDAFFWTSLYGRSLIINNSVPKKIKNDRSRNDFYISSKLARYPYEKVSQIPSWGAWREIITNKIVKRDPRVISWIISMMIVLQSEKGIIAKPLYRSFLKKINQRFEKIETSILTDEELESKLNELMKSE